MKRGIMVFSYYIYKYPYTLVYHLVRLFSKRLPVVLYVPYMLDWEVLEPVQKYLPELPIVTNNNSVKASFRSIGKEVYSLPFFPRAVIMARHSSHRFPAEAVVKISLRHGVYHFKRMTKAENTNLFNLYLMSSKADVEAAEAMGVNNAFSIGSPKLDSAFNGEIDQKILKKLAEKIKIDPNKQTLLFTSTWSQSGMSAYTVWIDRIEELTDRFNVLVTLHPWFSELEKERIRSIPSIRFIGDERSLPYIMLADICIGDNSSIIGECSALNKPLITFRTGKSDRSVDEIEDLLERISIRVDDFEGMLDGIKTYHQNPSFKEAERSKANELMFEKLDGKAGLRAAERIVGLLPEMKLIK